MPKKTDAMFAQLRKKGILEHVNRSGIATVQELCGRFDVSPATIRNDLQALEKAGLLERTHGGAITAEKAAYEPNTFQKEIRNAGDKAKIAEAALQHIHPGDAIALDSGTTTFQLAKLLGRVERLTVVTYDLQIAAWLEGNTEVSIIMAGGAVRRHFHCTAGQTAIDTLSRLRVDKAFLAANGASVEDGLSTPNMDIASIKSTLIRRADKRFLLCDHSKLGRSAFATFAPLDAVDVLITDRKADAQFVEAARALGVEIILA